MIYFAGCSYTWGAGLQFELLSKRGWTASQINDMIPPKTHLEHLDYECDEYRKKHHFPNLVAKEMDMAYGLGKVGNGGANDEISHLLNVGSIYTLGGEGQCKIIIIQFTDWTRDDTTFENSVNRTIEHHVKLIADACDDIRNDKFIKSKSYKTSYPSWVGLSWHKDIGKLLEKDYPENFIPLYYKKERYNNFESFRESDGLILSRDGHFNSKGCKVIADSIVKKLKQYETKTNKK